MVYPIYGISYILLPQVTRSEYSTTWNTKNKKLFLRMLLTLGFKHALDLNNNLLYLHVYTDTYSVDKAFTK